MKTDFLHRALKSSIMNNVIYADLRSIGISIRPFCE